MFTKPNWKIALNKFCNILETTLYKSERSPVGQWQWKWLCLHLVLWDRLEYIRSKKLDKVLCRVGSTMSLLNPCSSWLLKTSEIARGLIQWKHRNMFWIGTCFVMSQCIFVILTIIQHAGNAPSYKIVRVSIVKKKVSESFKGKKNEICCEYSKAFYSLWATVFSSSCEIWFKEMIQEKSPSQVENYK